MKHFAAPFSLMILLLFTACQSDTKKKSNDPETIFDPQETKNEFIAIDDKPLFLFTKVPEVMTGCKGIFARTEEELEEDQFIFASDLETNCFIALNGKFLQVALTSKRTMNIDREFYRFEGNGYLINLEIREIEKVDKYTTKYRGQLKIYDHSKYREVVYITGKVEC